MLHSLTFRKAATKLEKGTKKANKKRQKDSDTARRLLRRWLVAILLEWKEPTKSVVAFVTGGRFCLLNTRVNAFFTEACLYASPPVVLHIS